jgi:glycosyltransferase involved in cell wall biosynthesis
MQSKQNRPDFPVRLPTFWVFLAILYGYSQADPVIFSALPFLPQRPRTVVLDLRPLQCGYAGKGIGRYTYECARRILAASQREAASARPRFRAYSLVRADRDNPLPDLPVLIAAPAARRPWLWDQTWLPALLWRHRVRVFHSFAALGPLPEISFPVLYGSRGLATVHDWHMFAPDAPDLDRHYRGTLRIRIQKRRLPKARRVIVDAEQARVDSILFGGLDAARIRVVPLGGDHLDAVESAPWPMENFVLSVGDTPTKNLPLAFAALAALRDRFVHLNWVIVGARANVEARLARASGGALPPWITVLENPDDAVLKACYRSALCLLFPSTREGFGIPVLEAMRLGCPALVSAIDPLQSLSGYAPATLPPDAPAAWSEAIRNLLFFPAQRQAHIAHGKDRAQDFTWDKTAQALIDLYLE